MSKKITSKAIPEVINNFNVYNGEGNNFVGITAEMNLAPLTNLVESISGAGISGNYNAPIIGHYDSIQQEVPFRVLYKEMADLANPLKPTRVNIRGAIQVTDKATGVAEMCGFRYVVGGRCTGINPGTAQPGKSMGSSLTIEATYLLIELDGEKVIEIDKLNNICRIDGVDLLEEVRRYC